MKYYYRQNIARYEKMHRLGIEAWAEQTYGGTDYADFSSRPFLDDVVPRLQFADTNLTALELGTGVVWMYLQLRTRGDCCAARRRIADWSV